jgi:penicillin-binding protein 2
MGNSMRAETSGIRLSILGVTVIGLFAALFSRLWFLQVAAEPGLERIVASNRIRTVPLPPTRGRILDEKGRVLADNRQGLSVVIDRNGIRNEKKRFAAFDRLSGPLNKTVAEMEARYKDVRYDPLLPLPLAEDVPETMAIFLRERLIDYPGVDLVDSGQRSYRFSPVASAIVGYMGKIQKGSENTYSKENGYAPNDLVGIYGIEKSFEKDLRGKPGSRRVEIDSNNRVVRVLDQIDPEPGYDVQLTIDIKKQQFVEQILQAEILKRRTERPPGKTSPIDGSVGPSGPLFKTPEGAVAVVSTDGDVVALASNPGFDNRWYDGTTDGKVLQSLFGSHDEVDPTTQEKFTVPNNNAPLVDRSISTQFQIGSTMKLFTSVAAIRNDLLDPYQKYNDTGKWTMQEGQCKLGEPGGCSKGNADGAVYGEVNLAEALAVSSDAYFYTLGESLWIDTPTVNALQTELRNFGLGKKLGIDLPNETSGLVPDEEIKKALAKKGVIGKFEGSKYFTGDNVQLAIGQGLLGVTPLQLANGYATFANGGTLWKPRIAKAIYATGTPDLAYGLADVKNAIKVRDIPVERLGYVDLPDDMTEPIKKGLRGVLRGDLVNGKSSTAADTFKDWDFEEFPIWGKTGTAQAANQKSEFDNSLFASFGGPKSEPPKYAVASILKEAGFGGQASAPIVKCIWTALMNEKNMPELLPVTPLDRANPLPRAAAIPPDFDASCLNVDFKINRREN